MILELHITLTVPRRAEAALEAWAHAHSLQLLCVELDRAEAPRQVMLTTRIEGTLANALAVASEVAGSVARELSLTVERVKVERDTNHAGACPAVYLEHHVKVRTQAAALSELAQIADANGARLSRNARKLLEQGTEERFLTQRFPPNAREPAERMLAGMLEALRAASFAVLKSERELVLYDDNLGLDRGWLSGAEP